MSITEDLRAMNDSGTPKKHFSRLYLKNGYIVDYPERFELLDIIGMDDECEYLGAAEVANMKAPVALFRCPYASPADMPESFRKNIEKMYFEQFPEIRSQIQEKDSNKLKPVLGVFVLTPGRKRYPYQIKIYRPEPKIKKILSKFYWS